MQMQDAAEGSSSSTVGLPGEQQGTKATTSGNHSQETAPQVCPTLLVVC